ncbi:MAG: transposase, partial [Thermodesulfobacteriota bacterium]|nr:transposase [Thermodesulfobacteriota bacterium]
MNKQAVGLEVIYPNAAGVDIGSEQHFCSVGANQEVRSFSAFTYGLQELCGWFRSQGVTHVAMESTGCYWIPLYEMLEREGFEVALINAAHVK